MRFPLAFLVAAFSPFALADVTFTTPAAGAILPGGGAISVAWTQATTGQALSTFASYQLMLMAGGNDAASMQQLSVIVANGLFTTGNVAQGVISAGLGGDDTNAYFLKMVSVSKTGGQVINYSSRFTLTGMTGTFPAAVQAGITALAGSTAGPASENNLADAAATTVAGANGPYAVPYSLQTGLTRYAPMQPVPPTKITKKTWTPLFPTSAFIIASTYMPVPTIVTTMTASQTFSVSSVANTAAAASQPVGNAQQRLFLERWKD